MLPPAEAHSEVTPGEGGAGKPGHWPLNGHPPEEVGLGNAEDLFCQMTNQHELLLWWFIPITNKAISVPRCIHFEVVTLKEKGGGERKDGKIDTNSIQS